MGSMQCNVEFGYQVSIFFPPPSDKKPIELFPVVKELSGE
jgi:hypothetical protein